MNRYKLFLGIIVIVIILYLLVILLIYFTHFTRLSNHQPFKDIWVETDNKGETYKEVIKKMLKTTLKICSNHDINLVAIDGTLLCIERHKGIIPWHGVIDFVIAREKWDDLLSLKNEFTNVNLGITQYSPTLIKIYNKSYPLIVGTTWSWPFIDIFHYRVLGEHVVIDEPGMKNCFSNICGLFRASSKKILSKDFFPLRMKFLEGIPVNTPNRTHKILIDEYGKDWETVCVSSNYNHRKEKPMKGIKRVSCATIESPVNIFDNVWIINLDCRPDRWRQTKQRLSRIGIWGHRWSATDKKSLSINTNRTPGEVACYHSHLKLWRHIYDSKVNHAIIFEDDISIPPTLTLDKIKESINDSVGFNILLLGYCGTPLFDSVNFSTSSRVGRGQCAHAYAVSRKGLKLLLSYNHDFTQAVDEFMYDFCKNNLCYYTSHISDEREKLFGRGFFHQDEKLGSDIEK